MVLGPAPPLRDGTQRRKDKGTEGGRGEEEGREGEPMRTEFYLTLLGLNV